MRLGVVIASQSYRCSHTLYSMNCESYDQLWQRANGCCELCDRTLIVEGIAIDHDHTLGRWAVRGLLCKTCNAHDLRFMEAGTRPLSPRAVQYLANAWHINHPPATQGAPLQAQASGHAVKLPNAVVDSAQRIAIRRGETVSDVIRRALERYVKHNGEDQG